MKQYRSVINEVIDTLHKNASALKKLGLGQVYSYLYPPSGKPANGKADVMVSEVTTSPGGYGSNDFTHNTQTIQLNIFYGFGDKDHPVVNMDSFEDSIESFLFTQNWQVLPSSGRYPDPRTGQVTKVLQFKRRKVRWNLQV